MDVSSSAFDRREELKLAVGLVVRGGKEFIEKWIKSAEKIAHIILVVDNGADVEVVQTLLKHPKVKQYHRQLDMGRNQSRDYQKILEMAREEDATWIWNIDIDEIIPDYHPLPFLQALLNLKDNSIGFPLFEMRGDDKHYVVVRDADKSFKDARLVHKCYKVLSHFKFNEKDIHGISIPHNCQTGDGIYPLPIQHFGHYSKQLRAEKRKMYGTKATKDKAESSNTWLEEDETKIEIRKWEDFIKKWTTKS